MKFECLLHDFRSCSVHTIINAIFTCDLSSKDRIQPRLEQSFCIIAVLKYYFMVQTGPNKYGSCTLHRCRHIPIALNMHKVASDQIINRYLTGLLGHYPALTVFMLDNFVHACAVVFWLFIKTIASTTGNSP